MSDRINLIISHLVSHRDPASVPASAHAAALMWMQDSIGVAIAGRAVPQSQQLLAAVRGWGSANNNQNNNPNEHISGNANGARIWGSNEYLPTPNAALLNAFHIHNQEFDCVHERAVVHPMAVILAALLSYADVRAKKNPVSGMQLTAALALSVDVATVIGMSARRAIRFFRPAQCGCLGATAGLALLAGLDEAHMRDAFGLAYSQLAGTMQAHIEGTPALALQVGFAARAAVCAVDLAAQGFRGPHDILDGKHGYFALFEPDAITADAVDSPFAELGKIWQVERVSHKPFPTGRAAQGGIAGLKTLMQQHAFTADDIDAIVVFAPPLVRQLVDRPASVGMTANYARLCMPFLLATTLKHGTVGLAAYAAEALADEAIVSMAACVSMAADGNDDPNALRPQRIEVTLKDGQHFALAMPYVYGAPEAPMLPTEQLEKFIACCAHAPEPLPAESATTLFAAIQNLPNLPDVSAIVALMVFSTATSTSK